MVQIQHTFGQTDWKVKDRLVITYAARGLEPMRGIDIFVEIAKRICLIDQRVQIYIIGDNKVNYGSNEIPKGGLALEMEINLINYLNRVELYLSLSSKQAICKITQNI